MRAFLRFIINISLIAIVVWLVCRFTTLDEKIIEFFTKSGNSGNPTTQTSCNTPWGSTIPNGSSIFAYKADVGTNQGVCEEEKRTCTNGTLDGSYAFASCRGGSGDIQEPGSGRTLPPTGASCTTPWGQSIMHGAYIVSYESPSSCRFQRRMCVDGQLLGKFQYNYCMVAFQGAETEVSIYDVDSAVYQDPSAFSNEVNDNTNAGSSRHYTPVSYGGNIANYNIPHDYWNSNAKGNVIVTSTSNRYNPLSTYKNPSTHPGPKDWNNNETHYDLTQKGCNTPWGSYVDNGQYVIAYRSSTVAKGRSCEYERRNCSYGKLHGSFSFPSCTIKGTTYTDSTYQYNNQSYDNYYWPETKPTYNNNKSCRTPWGTTIKNGDYIKSYKYSSAPWSDGCEGEYRYCHNGVLDGSYRNKSCTLKYPTTNGCYGRQCGSNNWNHSCSLPRGGSISNGQSVVAYTRINGRCQSETRYCSNGYLNGSYGMSYCSDNTNQYNSCSLPRGGSIAHGQSVEAYSSPTSPCNRETRYCYNGSLNGSYQYRTCNNDHQYQSCTLPRGGSIQHGQSVEAFLNPTSPCTKEIRWCNNGSLNGSYSYQYCSTSGPVTPGISQDSYSNWVDIGFMDDMPNSLDTCHSDAIASFSCGANHSFSCTDYRKVANDPKNPSRGRYEKRSVVCVK